MFIIIYKNNHIEKCTLYGRRYMIYYLDNVIIYE